MIDWVQLLTKLTGYGLIGLLIECIFTGFYSLLILKDLKATSTSFLWMFPIYALGGGVMEFIRVYSTLPWLMNSLVYVAAIYTLEFGSGLTLEKLIGTCPWNYGRGKWTIMGLVNFKYFPFWMLVALGFNHVSKWLHALASLIKG